MVVRLFIERFVVERGGHLLVTAPIENEFLLQELQDAAQRGKLGSYDHLELGDRSLVRTTESRIRDLQYISS